MTDLRAVHTVSPDESLTTRGVLRAAQQAHWPASNRGVVTVQKDALSACTSNRIRVYIGDVNNRTKKAPRLLGGGQVLDGRGQRSLYLKLYYHYNATEHKSKSKKPERSRLRGQS